MTPGAATAPFARASSEHVLFCQFHAPQRASAAQYVQHCPEPPHGFSLSHSHVRPPPPPSVMFAMTAPGARRRASRGRSPPGGSG